MSPAKRQDYHERVSNRADEILDEALRKGEAFTEGLTNWAINQAMREVTP